MHSYSCEKCVFHFNSDFSGDIHVNSRTPSYNIECFEIPLRDLIAFHHSAPKEKFPKPNNFDDIVSDKDLETFLSYVVTETVSMTVQTILEDNPIKPDAHGTNITLAIGQRVLKTGKVKEDTKPNSSQTGIRIIGLEKRSQGGRAYKVLTQDGYYFDLREDVLLDTMLAEGVSANGVLNGSFVWGKVGSQMKLVRVGSGLHLALTESTKDGKLTKIPNSELQVGVIYSSKGGDRRIYLGTVDTVEYVTQNDEDTRNGWTSHRGMVYLKEINKLSNQMLWVEIPSYIKKTEKNFWRDNIAKGNCYFYIKMVNSHSMIKEEGTVPNFPSNYLEDVANCAIAGMRKSISERPSYSGSNDPKNLETLGYFSKIVNISKSGSGFPVVEEYKDFKI